jgi:hypothetical protein
MRTTEHQDDHALSESEAPAEQWLRDEVASAYDAYKANPDMASPLDEVAKRLDAFMDNVARKTS